MNKDSMELRALLAVVISMVVLILYQVLFVPKQPPKKLQDNNTQNPVTASTVTEKRPVKPAITPVLKKDNKKEKTIQVDTPLYSATLSTRGATIKNWALKKYKDEKGNPIVLTRDAGTIPALSIGLTEKMELQDVTFEVMPGIEKITVKDSPVSITFRYSSEGISVTRTMVFYPDDYRVDLKETVQGPETYWVALGDDFGYSGTEGYGGHVGPVVLKYSDRIEIKPKKLKETPIVYTEGLRWVAQEDKYFFASIVPPEKSLAKFFLQGERIITGVKLPSGTNSYLIYAGPKEHDRLKKLHVGLEHIIDFGFFSILARPLFWILKFFYKVVGNYGWAIILLTILTRIPFIPIMNKGQKSMKKLQELQPKIKEIQKKYKKDPKRMQEEMMKLYKKYKVNPMSGCLPILIQIPVFFALYKVLLIAIELRGAPFILWIQDLSQKDPYYILPIVMGITMFIQQKMTPTTTDAQQQKIMKYLPLIFTFLFLNFPSGLVLYWLVSNILGIAQQWFVNRKIKAEVNQ